MEFINTQVHVFQPSTPFVHLVVTPSTESVTYIFTVDLFTGSLLFSSIPYVDIFKSHRQACSFIVQKYNKPSFRMQEWQGKGLLGITIENQHLVIGLIEGARKCATLPNGSIINQINSTNFITIPLKSSHSPQKPSFSSFPINKMHFYCETMDLTRPYPSNYSVNDYDESFCWNQRWRLPFARFGVEFVCVVLLQGYAKTSSTSPYITYIIRRSVLNPYTRYTSRGTDEEGSPGNEAECELIFFDENKNQNFASNCWRRGSIPMMWKTVVGAVGSGQHIISQEQGNVTSLYFQSIFDRFENVPITVISLLNDSEAELNEAYKSAVKPLNFVSFQSFDIQSVPESQRIDHFQSFMKPFVNNDLCFTVGDKNGIKKRQQVLFRFNCVDSTDRTNLATFVYGRILTELRIGHLSSENKNQRNFLANAFVIGGDVISLLYTSTEATLTKPIRDTTENLSQAKHDTSLACIRRVRHIYGNDAYADKVIESWTSQKGVLNLNPFFSLDYFYISIIQDSSMCFKMMRPVDPSVVSFEYTSTKVDSSNGSFELIVELPMPMVICVIRFLFLPSCFGDIPKSFSLSCGMNSNDRHLYLKDVMIPDVKEPTFVKYSLYHAYRWGIQAPLEQEACEPVRFIWITFKQGTKNVPISTSSMGLLSFNVDKNSRLNLTNNPAVSSNKDGQPNMNLKSQTNNNEDQNNKPYLAMNHNHDKSSRFSSNNVSPVNSNTSQKLAIGNVLIDAYIPSLVSKIPSFDNKDSVIVESYKTQIERFLNEPNDSKTKANDFSFKTKQIDSFMRLELFRIKNRIPLHIRNQILIEKGINPIITSVRHYISRRTDPSLCFYCHEKNLDLDKNGENSFVFHEQFKSVLIQSKNLPHMNQSGFSLCKKCRERLMKCKNEVSEIDSMVIKEEPPRFSLRHWKIDQIKEQVCLSRRPLSTFLEFPPSTTKKNDINDLLYDDEEDEESDDSKDDREIRLKSDSKTNLSHHHHQQQRYRNSLKNGFNATRISNYNSCITADVIKCNDIISRSVDIDIDNDTFTYISNQSDDDVINCINNKNNCETNKTMIEDKNDDSSQQFIKKVNSIPYFINNNDNCNNFDCLSVEDRSKIKYVIDSRKTKSFTFTLCLSSFSAPTELIITFEGKLPEKVEIVAFKHSNSANNESKMLRSTSISATANTSANPSRSSSSTAPSSPQNHPPQSIQQTTNTANVVNLTPTTKRTRVNINNQNDANQTHDCFRNARLSLPPTSASISELNPRKHASFMVKNDDKIFVQFDPIQTSSLTFVVIAEEDQDEIVMKHVKVLGNFIEKPNPKPSWYSFPVPRFIGNKIVGFWDPETQTHTFNFKSHNILRRVNFKVPYSSNSGASSSASNASLNAATNGMGPNNSSSSVQGPSNPSAGAPSSAGNGGIAAGFAGSILPNRSCGNISGLMNGLFGCSKAEQMPQSVILAMYNENGKLVKHFHILIPQPQPPIGVTNCKEVEMNFQIADSPVFTTIKLFYLDLIDKFKPFEVSFLASFVESEKKH